MRLQRNSFGAQDLRPPAHCHLHPSLHLNPNLFSITALWTGMSSLAITSEPAVVSPVPNFVLMQLQPQRIGAARVRLAHGAQAAEGVYDCMFLVTPLLAIPHFFSTSPTIAVLSSTRHLPRSDLVLRRCTPRWSSGALMTVSMTLPPSLSSTEKSSVSCAVWTST